MAQNVPSNENTNDRFDLKSEITTLKLQLYLIKDMLQMLDVKVNERCRHLTNILLSEKVSQNLEPIAEAVFNEYSLLKADVEEVSKKIKEMIHKTKPQLSSEGYKLTVSVQDPTSQIQRQQSGASSSNTNVGGRHHLLDEKRLTINLTTLMKMVEDYGKENEKLKQQNKLLTREVMELTPTNLTTKEEKEIITKDYTEPQHSTNFSAHKGMKEVVSEFQKMKLAIQSTDENLEAWFHPSLYFQQTSFSHDPLNIQDLSFIIDVSETKQLSKKDWIIALDNLKNNHEAMTITDVKLATLRAEKRTKRAT